MSHLVTQWGEDNTVGSHIAECSCVCLHHCSGPQNHSWTRKRECVLTWWELAPTSGHTDEQMSSVSSASVWRSLRSRCWRREHLLVNRSISAKVTFCLRPSPSLSRLLSPPAFSVYFHHRNATHRLARAVCVCVCARPCARSIISIPTTRPRLATLQLFVCSGGSR